MRTFTLAVAAGLVLAGSAHAQEPLPLGTRVGNTTSASGDSGFEEGGHRDPFVSLLAPKKAPAPAPSARPKSGLAGVAIADVAVKGIIHNGTTTVAVLEGPGGQSFIVRSKDRLQDAVVKSIDPDGVVFVEQTVDAAGAAHSREVRKTLRAAAEGAR